MIEPAQLEAALEQWAAGGARAEYSREVASVYRAYRERLDALGMVDDELYAWRAVNALRDEPQRWGRTPVFVYGFDDFTPIELDALETLSGRVGVDVVVSLPYERGGPAFKAVAPIFEELSSLAGEHVELEASSEHYAPESRAALHHLERGLYTAPADRANPGDAVRLMLAGGERAEVEQVGAQVLNLIRGGTPAGDIAVVFRDPSAYASLVEQVFGAYGIPFSIEKREVPLSHTALGRGLLALLRCAAGTGTADDLLAFLRTPGFLEQPRIADRLEAEVRKAGAHTAVQARRIWEERRWPLSDIDVLRRAGRGLPLLAALDTQLERLFASAYKRDAHVFAEYELDDPRVATEARKAIAALHELASADPSVVIDLRRAEHELGDLRVRLGERPRPDRARRFAHLFVCGLQEGEFPRPRASEPFLPDDDRRDIAAASGLRLPVREDQLERERHLFYVCASRAEKSLTLSARFADEEGNPQVQSFLLEDVRDLFTEAFDERATRRGLSDVTWPLPLAPTAAEWDRALALAGPRHAPEVPDGLHDGEVLASLGAEKKLSAGALESFADCPVKWLVDKLLHPEELEPDPEPMVRGNYAHTVLEATYTRLKASTGSARVTDANLDEAEGILLEEMQAKQSEFQLSPKETRVRAAVRRLEFDLLRHLRREADAGGDFEPTHFEHVFDDMSIDGVTLRGRIDRIDVRGGHALVRDYKSGKNAYPVGRWEKDNRLQAAVYMLAVREQLGLQPVGGVYVPLAAPKGKDSPRGLLLDEDRDDFGSGFKKEDVKGREEFDAELARARERVCEIAGQIRTGDVKPCPDTCAWNGGCSYPSICRVEKA
jgi:ATP-dependent helicase/DNAse subunit B